VFSIGRLGQGQESYYLEAVAQGVEDYYTGVGEPPGRWVGSAARELGIGGAVDDDSLRAVPGGDHPRTGDPLAARHGGARVPGFDLTFSAPKSVSVLFGLSGDDLSAQICGAHESAVDAALDYMERHEDVRRRLVEDWWEATAEGQVAMIALRRTDVADLDDRARALMRAHGRLGPDTLRVGDRDFAAGDHVVALKNARRLDIVNGTRGVVTGIDQVTGALALRTSDGRDLDLPRSYLESQAERGSPPLDHGYAVTGHKAQGMTADNAFVLGTDELYREWGYVAMSRGSLQNRLYVVSPSARERDEYAPVEHRRDPLERLRIKLGHSRAQTAALDVATGGSAGDELDGRRASRLRATMIERPEYLLRELGPYPDRRSERRAWERAARSIDSYRARFGVDDPTRAFGDEPREMRQRSARRETQHSVDRALRNLGRRRAREGAGSRAQPVAPRPALRVVNGEVATRTHNGTWGTCLGNTAREQLKT
jgi:hypothetical protein